MDRRCGKLWLLSCLLLTCLSMAALILRSGEGIRSRRIAVPSAQGETDEVRGRSSDAGVIALDLDSAPGSQNRLRRDLRLPGSRRVRVEGTVTTRDGNPAPEADVRIEPSHPVEGHAEPGEGVLARELVSPSARYSIQIDLAPGEYRVIAESRFSLQVVKPLTVLHPSPGTYRLDFVLNEFAKVEGVLRGPSGGLLSHALVQFKTQCVREDGGRSTLTDRIKTDPSGRFQFPITEGGDCCLIVCHPVYETAVVPLGSLTDGAGIQKDIQLTRMREGTLCRTWVIFDDGTIAKGAGVTLSWPAGIDSGDGMASMECDDRGEVEFVLQETRTYMLRVEHRGAEEALRIKGVGMRNLPSPVVVLRRSQ